MSVNTSSSPFSVIESFDNQTVTLTGVTGYLGQLFLAKLLYVVPNVKQVYVIIRSKSNQTSHQRFMELIKKSLAYELIKKKYKSDWINWINNKVIVMNGDIGYDNYNLSNDDYQLLINNTNIFIHSAADVSFTTKFSQIVKSNLIGTVHSINLAKQCSSLTCFCYISTAYVSSHKRFETYTHYPTAVEIPFDVNDLIKASFNNDKTVLDRAEEKMKQLNWPNTYVMSKACAEDYVRQFTNDLPIVIIRPSMIASVWKDLSQPGWNMAAGAGPTLCVYAIALGGLTLGVINENIMNSLDLVPSDYCCNVMLATISAHLHDLNNDNHVKEAKTYYAALGQYRPTINIFYKRVVDYFRKHPEAGRMRKPRVYTCSGDIFDKNVYFRYTLPLKFLKVLNHI